MEDSVIAADYTKLIDRLSKDVVSKSKFSSVIAESLREFDKKFCKKNITRWNSTLFFCRSILKVNDKEFKKIQKSMRNGTEKEKSARANFKIEIEEREMLTELVEILEWFEFVTNEFQSNRINISRVYPCIKFLEMKLQNNSRKIYHFTNEIIKKLRSSLDKRFKCLIEEDCYKLSTFFDCNFGLDYFDEEAQQDVRNKIKDLIEAVNVVTKKKDVNNKDLSKIEKARTNNYVCHRAKISKEKYDSDTIIDDYIRVVSETNIKDTLEFWRQYSERFPELAILAKKYLATPASSASVERIFSISGHIFSVKRRRLHHKYFSELVFLKLNELFM
jgi:hypothetical protein